MATDDEAMRFVDAHALHASGLAYVDAQLLAATRLTSDAAVWTADRRLATVADRLGVGYAHVRE
jgi:predicted nucleic acid-binding protein